MLDQTDKLPQTAAEILGDLAGLAEQLGGTDGLCRLPLGAASLQTARVNTVAGLMRFLNDYTSRILIPHELPAIARAYEHVSRYEARELIALDQALGAQPILQGFARASQAVGRSQLQRLRPLRGERVVQRYLTAVEAGEAQAWHTLVFGLVLAIYSLPLRQGLLHFAHQTLSGFVESARSHLAVGNADRRQLLAGPSRLVVAAVETVVAQATVR